MDGGQSISTVTLQMLNSLIDTQTRLRDAAETRWASAREAMFNLARLIAADWLEQKQHEKGGLEAIRMEELSRVVYQRISELYAVSIIPEVGLLQQANQHNQDLVRERDELLLRCEKFGQENLRLQAEIEQMHSDNKRLFIQNEKLKNNPLTGEIPSNNLCVPSWFNTWVASAGFERQSFVIRLIGDTGIARRPEIVKAIANKFSIDYTSGAVSNVVSRLKEMGFINIEDTAGTGNGAPPQVLALDRLGETAYIFLTQKLPVENEYHSVRSAHSTDAHTLLVLKAATILEAEGYEIGSKGEINIPMSDGRISSPDILARKNGREIHVEVERDVNKGDSDARARKWQNAFDAGQGWLYVFCETEEVQKKLIQEINRALASESRLQRANTLMTNLEVIKAGKRHADGSIWVSQKHPINQK
jgi:hypothetical protein